MESKIQKLETFTILVLSGEIDFNGSPGLREDILAGLGDRKNLLVDLAEVTYIDSSGIASLVEGLQFAKSRELVFGLVGASDSVMGVLKLTRLDKVFPMFQNADEAIVEDK